MSITPMGDFDQLDQFMGFITPNEVGSMYNETRMQPLEIPRVLSIGSSN